MSSHADPNLPALALPLASAQDAPVRREWWQRRPTGYIPTMPFAVELEVHDGYDFPRAITREILTLEEVTIAPGEKLPWRKLTVREATELVMQVNYASGWSAFELLEYDAAARKEPWQLPLRKKGEARVRQRAPSPHAVATRRKLEAAARVAIMDLPTRDLAELRVELQRRLQAVEDEETMRWGALCDEADRTRRPHLSPAARRGPPLWWIEEDFPNHARLYQQRHEARGTKEGGA